MRSYLSRVRFKGGRGAGPGHVGGCWWEAGWETGWEAAPGRILTQKSYWYNLLPRMKDGGYLLWLVPVFLWAKVISGG